MLTLLLAKIGAICDMKGKSPSEQNGIEALRDTDVSVLSVGISTAGEAEMAMASMNPERHITATTLDADGAETIANVVASSEYVSQIEIRIQDVVDCMQHYAPDSFDFVYARLVLHYLSEQDLMTALIGIHAILKEKGRLFIVVRSDKSPEAQQSDNEFDPITKLTTYISMVGTRDTRYFHTPGTITSALRSAGFDITHIDQYDEDLSPSFARDDDIWVPNNVIEVLVAKK
jgi:cyclopropane fatty-acyl-phospholipid synthase-like methyltransferase